MGRSSAMGPGFRGTVEAAPGDRDTFGREPGAGPNYRGAAVRGAAHLEAPRAGQKHALRGRSQGKAGIRNRGSRWTATAASSSMGRPGEWRSRMGSEVTDLEQAARGDRLRSNGL